MTIFIFARNLVNKTLRLQPDNACTQNFWCAAFFVGTKKNAEFAQGWKFVRHFFPLKGLTKYYIEILFPWNHSQLCLQCTGTMELAKRFQQDADDCGIDILFPFEYPVFSLTNCISFPLAVVMAKNYATFFYNRERSANRYLHLTTNAHSLTGPPNGLAWIGETALIKNPQIWILNYSRGELGPHSLMMLSYS